MAKEAETKKYAKYVHELTPKPKGAIRNVTTTDANDFPLMTHHLEAITYHHKGSVYIPGKPFPLTMKEYKEHRSSLCLRPTTVVTFPNVPYLR
jgi:hypothetical protein